MAATRNETAKQANAKRVFMEHSPGVARKARQRGRKLSYGTRRALAWRRRVRIQSAAVHPCADRGELGETSEAHTRNQPRSRQTCKITKAVVFVDFLDEGVRVRPAQAGIQLEQRGRIVCAGHVIIIIGCASTWTSCRWYCGIGPGQNE
jgi:hypothetical protein